MQNKQLKQIAFNGRAQSRLVQNWRERTEVSALGSGRPALWRRGLAELIDRMFPLPFLAFIFPKWIVVVFLYHLLRDSSPTRRSVGKVIFRLRVVSADDGRKCAWHQAVLRRVGSAASQSAWCMWEALPFVMLYELISLAFVLVTPAGRRPEDFVAGTHVVTERVFRRSKKDGR